MKLRALVVDDEPLARATLRAFLETEPDVEVVGECGSGGEALTMLRDLAPDLLYLDIDLPEMDGFALLEALRPERTPQVIFVTAHEEHAVHAFDVQALDYLVKPFGIERFRQALQRARTEIAGRPGARAARLAGVIERLRQHRPNSSGAPPETEDPASPRFAVRKGTRIILVRAGEVDWLEAHGNYVRLHVGPEVYLLRETLSAMERRLDPARFLRIHRSAIVNLEQVRELRPWHAGDHRVLLRNGTELRLSRSYRQRMEAVLGPGTAEQ